MSEPQIVDQGYFVNIPADVQDFNATFTGADGEFGMHVYEISTDFQVGGSTAQSRKKRDFYAHNFVQPSFKIKGQCANSANYNALSLYIRKTQKRAIANPRKLVKFFLKPSPLDTVRHWAHKGILAQGYIGSMPAGAERFKNMVEYEFDFFVVRSVQGIYKDTRGTSYHLKDPLSDVFKDGGKFVKDPDAKPLKGSEGVLPAYSAGLTALQIVTGAQNGLGSLGG